MSTNQEQPAAPAYQPIPIDISRRIGALARALLDGTGHEKLDHPTVEGIMILAWRDVVIAEWRAKIERLDPVARRVANICIAWAEAEHGDAWELCVPHPMAVRAIAHRDLNVPVPVAGGLLSAQPIWHLYRVEVERRLHGQLREADAFEAARLKVDGAPGMPGANAASTCDWAEDMRRNRTDASDLWKECPCRECKRRRLEQDVGHVKPRSRPKTANEIKGGYRCEYLDEAYAARSDVYRPAWMRCPCPDCRSRRNSVDLRTGQ